MAEGGANGNGNTLLGLGSKMVGALPGPFLALVMVNLVIIGGLFWLEDQRNEGRERLLTVLLQACTPQHSP